MSIDTLVKVAAGLSVPPEELLDGIGWNPGSLTEGGFGISAEDAD